MNFAFTVLLTYLAHSTLWFGIAYAIQSIRNLASPLKVKVWQCAGLAGLFSTLIAVLGWGDSIHSSLRFDPLTIHPPLLSSTETSLNSEWRSLGSALPTCFVIIWAIGALFQLTRFAWNLKQLFRCIRARNPLRDPQILNMVHATARQMGLRRTIRVSSSEVITSPIALTWREICFPRQLLSAETDENQIVNPSENRIKDHFKNQFEHQFKMDAPTLRAILGHELCHLRRFDPIALPLFYLIAAIAWPQILWRQFFHYRDLEVERICDRAGSQIVNSPRLMAEALLRVAQWIGTLPHERTVPALQGHQHGIHDRVSQLLSSSTAPMGRKQKISMYLIPSAMFMMAAFIPQIEASSSTPLATQMNKASIQNLSGDNPPRLRRQEARADGAMDKAEIRGVVRANIDQIRHCYNQALEGDPTLEGALAVSFTIGAKGTVISSKLAWSNLDNATLETCIVDAMTRWNYPKPEDGGKVAVTYPFNLSPG